MIESKLSWLKSLRGVGVSSTQYLVLVTISTYTDKNGLNAHPGWVRLQSDTGLQLNTIKKAVKVLLSKRLLILSEEGGNQHWKGKANVYELGPVLSVRTSEDEGVQSETQGVQSTSAEGVNETHPHQVSSPSGPPHNSDSDESGTSRAMRDQVTLEDLDMDSWHDSIGFDDFVDGLDSVDQVTANGLSASGMHPKAIGNVLRLNGAI